MTCYQNVLQFNIFVCILTFHTAKQLLLAWKIQLFCIVIVTYYAVVETISVITTMQ